MPTKFDFDFAFIGHFENDDYPSYIYKIAEHPGRILIAGDKNWPLIYEHALSFKSYLTFLPLIYFIDYPNLLSRCKFPICLFSFRNNDSLTRRRFEVPAAGSILISRKSAELDRLLGASNYCVTFHTIKIGLIIVQIVVINFS